RRNAIDALQLRLALSVEGINALFESEFDFARRFSDTGKRAFARVTPGSHHALQFAAADDVETAARFGERAQNGSVGFGLDRKGNEMILARHRAIELFEMAGQCLL